MNDHDYKKILFFYEQEDENGVSNLEKAVKGRVIRRIASTCKDKSFEETDIDRSSLKYPFGTVDVDGKFIGLGIHIYNADVYPIQSFEIFLRGCDLIGHLDLSGCKDLVFIDLYHNRISSVDAAGLPSLRILGLQDNRIRSLDPTGMPACQGIDIGMNRLTDLDVSHNPELVELYINDNDFTGIDLSQNPKLKYLYCHNNRITELDTTHNPLLRHLNATGNPMKRIRSLAPQRDEALPLNITASEGGCVGLKFNPVYNAQWKETGEWQQSYYAYPDEGYTFICWRDPKGDCLSEEATWIDVYGTSRELTAVFGKCTL